MDQNQNLNQLQGLSQQTASQQQAGTIGNFTPLKTNSDDNNHDKIYTIILIPLIMVLLIISVVLGFYIFQLSRNTGDDIMVDDIPLDSEQSPMPSVTDNQEQQATDSSKDMEVPAPSDVVSSPAAEVDKIIKELDNINPDEINTQDPQVEQDINALQ
ncbi:MAG: hypothetical protein KatS3mg090_0684 [Patescibacteria group bacterium]|nr:MAG: hypothetical protein KatS3mg090_0684 [Patescibacteria group bacterium]